MIDMKKDEIVNFAKNIFTGVNKSTSKFVMDMEYGLDEVHIKTQDEVAEIFGCSKTTIAKQEAKA